jgi:hypothetical protein
LRFCRPYAPRPTDEFDAFIRPATEGILAALRESACILTASGAWARPGDVLLADERVRDLVPNELARRQLRKEFVAPEFVADRSLLATLRTADFTPQQLVRCLGDTGWVKAQPDPWFAKLFAYLGDTALDNKPLLESLRTLPIVPLEGGNVASVKQGQPLFLPLSRGRKYGFEDALTIVRSVALGVTVEGVRRPP